MGDGWGDATSWHNHKKGLAVLGGVEEIDGEKWLHVSISHQKRMPTYDEMVYLKRHWFGNEATALEIHPPRSEHVNLHKFCRHLWTNLERRVVPDLRRVCSITGDKSI